MGSSLTSETTTHNESCATVLQETKRPFLASTIHRCARLIVAQLVTSTESNKLCEESHGNTTRCFQESSCFHETPNDNDGLANRIVQSHLLFLFSPLRFGSLLLLCCCCCCCCFRGFTLSPKLPMAFRLISSLAILLAPFVVLPRCLTRLA